MLGLRRGVALVSVVLLFAACGARSSLVVYERDGGPDVDAPPPPPLELECGRSLRYTTPRLPITIDVGVTASAGIASETWTLVSTPPASMVALVPTTGPTTTLDPDQVGFYELRFDATDTLGNTARCDYQIEAVVGPPRAICPEEELRAAPGELLLVEGGGFDDEGVVSYQWTQRDGPAPAELTMTTTPTLGFRSSVTGTYRLDLTVGDADGATHTCTAVVQVVGAPMVVCPDVIEGPTRQPLRIEVRATDDTRIADFEWRLIAQPEGSTARVRPGEVEGDLYTATLVPDRQGEYLVEFTVTDEDGLTASCTILVIGLPTPPEAICTDVDTTPLTPTPVEGRFEDDGEIVRVRWEVVGRPPGSSAEEPRPATEARTTFTPDLAGEYRLEFTVTDDDGESASCIATVRAIANEGLRIEMFWDSPSTDMDLHLLNAGGERWRTNQDCYYVNCTSRPYPSWGPRGDEDDPNLDIDDTDGFGPENINIETPANGTYRVGTYAYRGNGSVTVRIYCGGSTTEPRRTFGPVTLRGTGGSHDFWRVADVTVRGDTCDITELGEVRLTAHDGDPFPR